MVDIVNNEIIVAAVFLLPGFLCIYLIYEISTYNKRKITEHEHYLFSLLLSILFFILISLIRYLLTLINLGDFPDIFAKSNTISLDFSTIVLMYLVAIFSGVIIGKIYKKRLGNTQNHKDSVWLYTFHKLNRDDRKYIHIITSANEEFMGSVKRYSDDIEEGKIILIENPSIIVRDENYKCIKEIKIGTELLFTENDIRRIFFIDET